MAEPRGLEDLLDRIRRHDASRQSEVYALKQQVETLQAECTKKNLVIRQLKSQVVQLTEFKRSIVKSINSNPSMPDTSLLEDDHDMLLTDVPTGTPLPPGGSSYTDSSLLYDAALNHEVNNVMAEMDRTMDRPGRGMDYSSQAHSHTQAHSQPPSNPRMSSRPSSSPQHNAGATASSTTPSAQSRSSPANDMEGHEFFMMAKQQLSYPQFQSFLQIIKQFNQHERSKEDTLAAAREIFGDQHENLYSAFHALLTRASTVF